MADKTIPELNSGTPDQNSLFPFDSGVQTFKVTSPNLAQALRPFGTAPLVTPKTSTYAPTSTQAGSVIPLDSSGGSFNIELPDPATMIGKGFFLKDIAGSLNDNPVTLVRDDGEDIEGLTEDFLLQADFGSWFLFTDGVDWFLI